MRICFLGVSSNLASYARRFCRRLVKHHRQYLLEGPELLEASIADTALREAIRTPGLSAIRRGEIEKILRQSTAYETATEIGTNSFGAKRSAKLKRCAFTLQATLCVFIYIRPLPFSRVAVGVVHLLREICYRAKCLLYSQIWKPSFAKSWDRVPNQELLHCYLR